MGLFSWCFADCGAIRKRNGIIVPTRRQRLLVGHPGYLLVPAEYGKSIFEPSYGGDGVFRHTDVYEAVVLWNRKWLSEHPSHELVNDFMRRKGKSKTLGDRSYYRYLSDMSLSLAEVVKRWNAESGHHRVLRDIGIDLACEDEDNAALPYPIKISSRDTEYALLPPSLGDPGQGCD